MMEAASQNLRYVTILSIIGSVTYLIAYIAGQIFFRVRGKPTRFDTPILFIWCLIVAYLMTSKLMSSSAHCGEDAAPGPFWTVAGDYIDEGNHRTYCLPNIFGQRLAGPTFVVRQD